MKSYLAKLAARATLANVQPSPVANPTPDPFEEVSAPDTPTSARNFPVSSPLIDPSVETGLQPSVRTGETVRGVANSIDTDTRIESESSLRKSIPPVPTPESVRSVSETKTEAESHRHETVAQPQVLRAESNIDRFQHAQDQRMRETNAPQNVSAELKRFNSTKELNTDERLSEIWSEQAALLRKADAFMTALFDRKPAAKTMESNSEDEQPVTVVKAESVREPASRLQPVAKPRLLPETPPEQPSLVIGKLTVEVVPPTPQPPTPRRQVVVVRGRESSRRSFIHSSHRFGLGQF